MALNRSYFYLFAVAMSASCVSSRAGSPDAGKPSVDPTTIGVCGGMQFVPRTRIEGDECLLCGCDDENRAACSTCGPAEAGVGGTCGPKPPDYDGCLQWSCDAGAWRGLWICLDCPTDCYEPDAGPACAEWNKENLGCNLDDDATAPAASWSCYCGKGGNWACKPTGFCDDVDSGDPDGG
jgi:hypothetical protein